MTNKDVWFFSRNLKPMGPHTEAEIRLKIHRGEIARYDLVLQECEGKWRAAGEWRNFEESLFPAMQKVQPDDQTVIDSEWVLLAGQTQEGPYSSAQILGMVRRGQAQASQLIWKSGLSGWCQIGERPEFRELISSERL
jgi:hypothetical protein